MRTIRITGTGKLKVHPDTTEVVINLEDTLKTYEAALRKSIDDKEMITNAIQAFGFKKEDLKTKFFDIDTRFENKKDRYDNWKEVFIGYRYRHDLKLSFTNDNVLLGKVLTAITTLKSKPTVNIHFTVNDVAGLKNALLASAMKDAKEKAIIMSEAANVKLGPIQKIDYSWGEIDIMTNPTCMITESSLAAPRFYMTDMEPEDINMNDTVTVEWEIC